MNLTEAQVKKTRTAQKDTQKERRKKKESHTSSATDTQKKSHKNGKVLASTRWYGMMIVGPTGDN